MFDHDVAAGQQYVSATQVLQTDPCTGARVELGVDRIGDHQGVFGCCDRDGKWPRPGDAVVLDRVFDQWLERQGGDQPAVEPVVDTDVEKELALVAYLIEIPVCVEELELLAQGGHFGLSVLEYVTECVGYLSDIGQRAVVVFLSDQHGERVERIEEKVRVDLVDEHVVLGLQVLVLEFLVFQNDVLLLVDQVENDAVEHRNDQRERAFEDDRRVEFGAGEHGRLDHFAPAVDDRRKEIKPDTDQHGVQQDASEIPGSAFAARYIVRGQGHQDEREQNVKQDLDREIERYGSVAHRAAHRSLRNRGHVPHRVDHVREVGDQAQGGSGQQVDDRDPIEGELVLTGFHRRYVTCFSA